MHYNYRTVQLGTAETGTETCEAKYVVVFSRTMLLQSPPSIRTTDLVGIYD